MTIDRALKHIKYLAFDTVAIIYFIEQHPDYVDRMRAIMQRIDAGTLTGQVSTIALMELLVHPVQANNPTLSKQYESILTTGRHMRMIRIDAAVARQAAELRATYNLKTPDALHVAAAIVSGADAFLTNDSGIQRVSSEMAVLLLDNLELTTSSDE